ncbi:hypothetical protein [Azospirillum himalayense]|uniref:Uncharacterized protein n=1 Tax=Azospirillum himalayense TaxID=654847 RepID=A0ABW0GAN1_9PROT
MPKENHLLLKRLSVRVDALRRAMDAVMAGSTPDHAKWGAYKNYARAYNVLAQEYINASGNRDVNMYDTDKMGTWSSTVWPFQKSVFDTIYADTLILSGILVSYDTGTSASISQVQDLLSANLRKAIFNKPEKELDVQNSIEALLVGRGYQKSIDYDRESGKVKFSGKEFIPDFAFPSLKLSLEVKLIKSGGNVSKCIEEMSADIPAYLSVYENVLFCVYDLGEIRDVSEFQHGFQSHGGVRICVVKH